MSKRQFSARADKPNDTSGTAQRARLNGRETPSCPRDDCECDVTAIGRGTSRVDAAGCAVTEWRCPTHGYVVEPDWRDGDE